MAVLDMQCADLANEAQDAIEMAQRNVAQILGHLVASAPELIETSEIRTAREVMEMLRGASEVLAETFR